MRTVIYVYSTTKLTITANDKGLRVVKLDKGTHCTLTSLTETFDADAGIYKILSEHPVAVAGAHDANIHILVSPNSKSPVPVPPPKPPNVAATDDVIKTFFASDADGNIDRSL